MTNEKLKHKLAIHYQEIFDSKDDFVVLMAIQDVDKAIDEFRNSIEGKPKPEFNKNEYKSYSDKVVASMKYFSKKWKEANDKMNQRENTIHKYKPTLKGILPTEVRDEYARLKNKSEDSKVKVAEAKQKLEDFTNELEKVEPRAEEKTFYPHLRKMVSTFDIPLEQKDNKRRSGNSTRQVDAAIQTILSGHICVVEDHFSAGENVRANNDLNRKIIKRLQNEHSWVTKNEDYLIYEKKEGQNLIYLNMQATDLKNMYPQFAF